MERKNAQQGGMFTHNILQQPDWPPISSLIQFPHYHQIQSPKPTAVILSSERELKWILEGIGGQKGKGEIK